MIAPRASAFLLIALSLFTPAAFYFIGDPGVFDSMITDYGGGMNGLNNSDVRVFYMDGTLVGKATLGSNFRVLDLLKLVLPSFVETFGFDPGDVNNMFNFPVDNFTFSVNDRSWCIGSQELDDISLIGEFLVLDDVTALVCVSIDMDATSLADRIVISQVAIAGVWNVGDNGLKFKISKTEEELYFRGEPASGELPVGDFVTYIGSALLPQEFEEPLRNAGLDRFTIKQARFVGVNNVDGFAIGLSGNPTVPGLEGLRCHLIIHRYRRRSYNPGGMAVTLALNFPSFSLSNLINTLTGYDISDVPFLGTLTIPETGVIVSTKTLQPLFIPEILDGLLAQVRPVYKGVTLVAALPIVPQQSPVVFFINIGSGGLKLTIADPSNALTLNNIIRAIAPDFDIGEFEEVPSGISDILRTLLDVQIFGFTIMTQPKSFAVELRLNEPFEVIPNIARIINPAIFINFTLSKPRTKEIKAKGFWEFGSSDFPISIDPAPLPPLLPGQTPSSLRKPKGFLLTGEGDEISIRSIIDTLNADFLPSELRGALESASMLDFAIRDPLFKIPIGTGAKGFQIQLSGIPSVNNWMGVALNAVINKAAGAKAAPAVGFEFDEVKLADLIEKLTGKNVKALSLLDRSLKVAFIIASRSMEDVVLAGEALGRIPIRRGLSIVASFSFPADCMGDAFCDFAKGALGSGATLHISATISSLREFSLTAGVTDIQLGSGLTLSEAALEFAIGMETFVGIRATLQLNDPPLSFTGWLRAGLQGLEVGMTMNGIWKRPFGIDFLAFGNARISITLKPGAPVVGFEIGGEIHLGKIDSGQEIIGKCYVGIDPLVPRRNYFYSSVTAVTIQSLLEAFDIDLSLPKCLAESGLPRGLNASFSVEAREIRPPGIVIPPGFVLNCTIDILGWRLSASIDVGLPRGIKIDIRMDPLDIGGGVFKMYKSRDDHSVGPLLIADVTMSPQPKVNVTAAGYVSLFFGLLEAEIFLQVTDTYFLFFVRGRLFLFDALLKIYAPYGSLREASFRVYGMLSTEWLDKIREETLKIIKDAVDEADRQLRIVEADFQNAVVANVNAQAELRNTWEKAKNAKPCGTCPDKCNGCPGWRSCCSYFVFFCMGCPSWNFCCTKEPDIVCKTAKLLCENSIRSTLDGLLVLSQLAIQTTRDYLVASTVLNNLRTTLQGAGDAARYIVKLGLGGIISIKKIEFDILIGLVSDGHFAGKIVVSFLGETEAELSFNLRLKSVKDMALDMADIIFPGITGRRRRRSDVESPSPGFSHRHRFPRMHIRRPGDGVRLRAQRSIPTVMPTIPVAPTIPPQELEALLKRRLTAEEVQLREAELKEALVAWEKKAEETNAIPAIADPIPKNGKLLTIENLHKELKTDEEKCEHFYAVEGLIRGIPMVVQTSYGEWKSSVANFTAQNRETAIAIETMMENGAELTAALNDTTRVLAAFDKQAANRSQALSLSKEERDAIARSEEAKQVSVEVVDRIKQDYARMSESRHNRLREQNVNAVKSFMDAFGKRVYEETKHNLPDYLQDVFDALAKPYKAIETSDYRYEEAQIVIESIGKIHETLTTLQKETLFNAAKLSDILLKELTEIENTAVFCSGTEAKKKHLDAEGPR